MEISEEISMLNIDNIAAWG